MYKIIVMVFLCLCCFITMKPLNRRHHKIRPPNMSYTVAGNQSGFLGDYDLGLRDQGKDSISAGRGIRLFQYPPPMNNDPVAKREDPTTNGPKTEETTNSRRTPPSTKNYVQLWGLSVDDEGKLKPRARDGDGGNLIEPKAQETTTGEKVEREPEDDEDGVQSDEEENSGDAVSGNELREDTTSKVMKQKMRAAKPDPDIETETVDEEERDDDDDENDSEGSPMKPDEESEGGDKADLGKSDERFGFKNLLTSKSRIGPRVGGRVQDAAYEITYANNWKDTRVEEWRSALARAAIMSDPLEDYYPSNKKNLSSVCNQKSSIMNFPKVFKWLHKMILNITYHQRPIYIELRRELYEFGQSELCHKLTMKKWQDYQYCALIRNQRMDYMIPHYPLHQIGYRLLFKAQRGK
ncbi:uncharacterized protein LOC111067700 [Drosophila obscura]|uniref:uncharacterized protein LOC111067700 n=1 Tax=Drosophila obscura TaxID=7282 RepID=UPI001BB11F95|nr:uncharacterized protein LOC111067700 [Drosophila obscura]